jgi:ATP-dependent protease ClpP protease subunit
VLLGRRLEADPAIVLLQLVPAVTELIIAELLYLQYKDRTKPIFLYINSTGTSRADGETVRRAQATTLH